MRILSTPAKALTNISKYAGASKVLITVHAVQLNGGYVQLVFAVKDTGIGIAPEKMDLILKPFQQADPSYTRKYGGTGLGLALCKEIVQLHGGRIGVYSRPGQGTQFYMALPI